MPLWAPLIQTVKRGAPLLEIPVEGRSSGALTAGDCCKPDFHRGLLLQSVYPCRLNAPSTGNSPCPGGPKPSQVLILLSLSVDFALFEVKQPLGWLKEPYLISIHFNNFANLACVDILKYKNFPFSVLVFAR